MANQRADVVAIPLKSCKQKMVEITLGDGQEQIQMIVAARPNRKK